MTVVTFLGPICRAANPLEVLPQQIRDLPVLVTVVWPPMKDVRRDVDCDGGTMLSEGRRTGVSG